MRALGTGDGGACAGQLNLAHMGDVRHRGDGRGACAGPLSLAPLGTPDTGDGGAGAGQLTTGPMSAFDTGDGGACCGQLSLAPMGAFGTGDSGACAAQLSLAPMGAHNTGGGGARASQLSLGPMSAHDTGNGGACAGQVSLAPLGDSRHREPSQAVSLCVRWPFLSGLVDSVIHNVRIRLGMGGQGEGTARIDDCDIWSRVKVLLHLLSFRIGEGLWNDCVCRPLPNGTDGPVPSVGTCASVMSWDSLFVALGA